MAATPALRERLLLLLKLLGQGYFCATLAKIAFNCLKQVRSKRMLADVPYAKYKEWSAISSMRQNQHRLHDWRIEMIDGMPICKAYGMPFSPGSLYVLDPKGIKHFLKDNFENYSVIFSAPSPVTYYLKEFLGLGIFTTVHGRFAADGGEFWRLQRKIASSIFSRNNFNTNMHEAFVCKAVRLREFLDEQVSRGEAVDMQKCFFNFTMDSIMRLFFGMETDFVGGVPCSYGDAFDMAHKCALDYSRESLATLLIAEQIPWPLGGHGGLIWKLHAARSPTHAEFRRVCKILEEESQKMVTECRADPQKDQRRDLLALYVSAGESMAADASQQAAVNSFSDAGLRSIILNFMIAGRDTTACLLSWLFYELAVNPKVQEALVEEIDQKALPGTTPTLSSMAHREMPILHGAIYEALRLHPPVPMDIKVAARDDVLPDGTPVPAGTRMFYFPYGMGRDEGVYADPLVFRPQRWIPFVQPPAHEFPVFQAGPRICLGMDMAMFEAKVVTVMLLQAFRFEMDAEEAAKIGYNLAITMSITNNEEKTSHNLWMWPRRRRKA